MAVAVTGSPILAKNTKATLTLNAATADTDGLAEVFTFTPTRPNGVIYITGSGSGADGNIAYSIAAGNLWAGVAQTGTITKNTSVMIQVDSGNVLTSTAGVGTFALTLTPASTDKLLTNHALSVAYIEML